LIFKRVANLSKRFANNCDDQRIRNVQLLDGLSMKRKFAI